MRVVMFDIDTLRSDHLGCYGYGRSTSPAIDAIARADLIPLLRAQYPGEE